MFCEWYHSNGVMIGESRFLEYERSTWKQKEKNYQEEIDSMHHLIL